MTTIPNTPPGKMRRVEVCLDGHWMEGWTFGNTDSEGRTGVKLGTPSGASDWYLPEFVREPTCDDPTRAQTPRCLDWCQERTKEHT